MSLQGIETDMLFFVVFLGPFLAALAIRYRHELSMLASKKNQSNPAYWGTYGTSRQ